MNVFNTSLSTTSSCWSYSKRPLFNSKHIYDTQCNVGPWEIHLQSIWNSIFNIFNCPSSSLPVSVSKQVLGFGPCAFHCIRFLEIDPLLQYENMQYMAKVVPFYHKRTCGTENNKKYVFNTRIMKSRFSGSHQSIISQAAVLLHLLVWLASENCENRIVMMSFIFVNIQEWRNCQNKSICLTGRTGR